MKLIAIEKEVAGKTEADFQPHLQAEARRVWELYQAGIFREIYFRQDENTAVIVLECADLAQARETLASLPLVKNGLITFEIVPLAPYPGFARLFAETEKAPPGD